MSKSFWKNKKVFVTGHTGFKGSWLCLFLSFLGAEVSGYSLKPKNKKSLFYEAKIKNLIKKSIIADVRNTSNLLNELKKSKSTIVFHLAAQALVRESYINPIETIETNIMGTANILNAISKNKLIKSSVIITSDKVYDIQKNKIFKEKDLLGGIDPYSASKVCSEHIFNSYINSFFHKKRRFSLATARAGNVIGGGDYSKDRLVPDIVKSVLLKKKIYLRNPKSIRPWQHVLEPINGYLILAEKLYQNKLMTKNQSWNFGPNLKNCKTVGYVAKYFSKQTGLKIKVLKEKNKLFKKETNLLRLDNTKSKNILKWQPKWNLHKSIKMILEWNLQGEKFNKKDICFRQIKEYISS